MTADKNKNKWWGRVKSLALLVANVAILIFLVENLGYLYGAVGFLGIILVFTIYRIVTRWKSFINGVRMVETQMFGKPLEKNYWGKNEKPKLFRRNKKKERGNNQE